MKNIISILATALIVGGAAFYGGLQYNNSQALSANFPNSGNPPQSIQRQGGNTAFGRRINGAQAGNLINGQIISIDDKSLTVKLRDGGSKIVFFSASAQITKTTDGTSKDLVAGKEIMVNGTVNADGSITAQNIQIRPSLSTATSQKTQQ